MSECVVRMEIRKNCLDCDLHQIVYGDSYADTDVYCFKEKRFVGKRFGPTKDLKRPSWCPIICSLPEGHGRLIDASTIIGEVDAGYTDDYGNQIPVNRPISVDEYLGLEVPTIVPAERSEE